MAAGGVGGANVMRLTVSSRDQGIICPDGIVIASSHRASKDAYLSTGQGDAAIQSRGFERLIRESL
jgi:hypothetical protein